MVRDKVLAPEHPEKIWVSLVKVKTGHGMEAGDNEAWQTKRLEWANTLWEPVDRPPSKKKKKRQQKKSIGDLLR
jgi:hypothetical protein